MSRVPWSLVVVALLALPLVSCFHDVGDCPTCPPENSGSIGVVVPNTLDLDSVRVGLNGPPTLLVRRGQQGEFADLPPGTHTMNAVTYRADANGVAQSRSATLTIVLLRGESRVVTFHHDFPVVAWAPPAVGPANLRMATALSGPFRRVG